jgi:hypothetical protein
MTLKTEILSRKMCKNETTMMMGDVVQCQGNAIIRDGRLTSADENVLRM